MQSQSLLLGECLMRSAGAALLLCTDKDPAVTVTVVQAGASGSPNVQVVSKANLCSYLQGDVNTV